MNKKNEENLRIIFGNINTLPKESNRFKLDLWKEIVTVGCDINIVAEINKDTRRIARKDRTDQLVKGWWKSKIVCRDEFLVGVLQRMDLLNRLRTCGQRYRRISIVLRTASECKHGAAQSSCMQI